MTATITEKTAPSNDVAQTQAHEARTGKKVGEVERRETKSTGAAFGWLEAEQINIYGVNSHVKLDSITIELTECIANVALFLKQKKNECSGSNEEYKVSVYHNELNLLLARLDQASGLVCAIGNTIDDVEAGCNN